MGTLNSATAVGGQDVSNLLNMDDEARLAYMKQMGVRNILPPLPHSPCLKNKKTGIVLPWNNLLAEQQDLVECCDEHGNTDPAAWQPKVITKEAMTQEELLMRSQQQIIMQQFEDKQFARPATDTHPNEGPSDYERLGVIAFADIQKLRQDLKG